MDCSGLIISMFVVYCYKQSYNYMYYVLLLVEYATS